MKAKVTTTFRGCRDGRRDVEKFYPGTIIDGDLAAVAVRAGNAREERETPAAGVNPSSAADGAAPSNKAAAPSRRKKKASTSPESESDGGEA